MGKLSKILKAPLIILAVLGLLTSVFSADWISSAILIIILVAYFIGAYLEMEK